MHLSPSTAHLFLWTIFALIYLAMALGRIPGLALDRTGAAIVGAIAMIVVTSLAEGGSTALRNAAHSVDFETILLLFGLMLFSVQLRQAGFYTLIGRALTRATSRPRRLLAAIILISSVLSALLANDIVCLAFTPVLCAALLASKQDPIPYLIGLATSSNIGSAATVIGNPQNMYIGEVGELPFGHFTLIMLPITIISMVMCWAIIVMLWPKSFSTSRIPAPARSMPDDTDGRKDTPLDSFLICKTLIILACVILAFLYLPARPRVIAALAGGCLLLITRRRDSARLYANVDWNLLLLFFGLFVVNGTMKQSGLTTHMMNLVQHQGLDLHRLPTLAVATAILSNIVSNVPAVLLLQPSIPPNDRSAWYMLAMASTLAGNLTLVGSIANLIVAEQAAHQNVKLDLLSYCKAGIPLTLASLAAGIIWIIWMMGN